MANVNHASLTGAELHEPKGADAATNGTVYVADGAGSGSWQAIGTSAFTGQIADFAAPVAPTGWLECDGSTISTTTYAALFAVMAITSAGTRASGSAVITSIASTTNFKAGYYVFGTGIAAGTTILTVDSATQITLSANASSSGTSTIYVSPFEIGSGTIKLPDLTTSGRYRRSRTSSTIVGATQADQNQAHTHSLSVSGTTSSEGAHTPAGTVAVTNGAATLGTMLFANSAGGFANGLTVGTQVGSSNLASFGNISQAASTATFTGTPVSAHTHTVTSTGTSGSSGSTEARPLSMVFLTCIKT